MTKATKVQAIESALGLGILGAALAQFKLKSLRLACAHQHAPETLQENLNHRPSQDVAWAACDGREADDPLGWAFLARLRRNGTQDPVVGNEYSRGSELQRHATPNELLSGRPYTVLSVQCGSV